MDNNIRDFNDVAKVLLGLSMFAVTMAIIISFQKISLNSYIGGSNDALINEIIIDFLILSAAVLTFMKKRYGLIALIVLFVVRMFATIPSGGNIAYSYQLGGKMALFLRDFGFFAIAMCFKKDGVSGWKSMLASNGDDTKLPNLDESDTPAEENLGGEGNRTIMAGLMLDEEFKSVSNPHNTIESCQENIQKEEESNPVMEANADEPVHEEKTSEVQRRGFIDTGKELYSSASKSAIVTLATIAILMMAVVVTCAFVAVKSYPEYITSFGDKWKYTFNKPNNKLVNSLYEEAMSMRHTGGFFFNQGKNCFLRNSSSYYHNVEEYINDYSDIDVYLMQDTVKVKSDINTSYFYAARWHDSYEWGFASGEVVLDKYETLKEDDPNIVIIRLEKYDMQASYDKEHKLLSYAACTPATDPEIVKKVARYYEGNGNFNKAADIYSLALKYNKNEATIMGYLALSQYLNSEPEDAKITAQKAIEINPKEVSSLQVLCQLEADDFNWGEAKKWAKKAIDYGTENAEPYFVYAESLYKQGEKSAARENYNKAYNIDSSTPLAEKYKESGGCPFNVETMFFAFTKKEGEIITDYGEKLYSSKSQYITTKAVLNVLRAESCKVQCKLYSCGGLSTGEDSNDGYTYESELYLWRTGETERKIGGWGNSIPGNWKSGNYRFEIWYGGEKVAEEAFYLH